MCAVAAPADRPHLQPTSAERLLRDGVFLPVYPELPENELERLIGVIAADRQHEFATAPATAAATAPRPW
jgi:hypothetical protein